MVSLEQFQQAMFEMNEKIEGIARWFDKMKMMKIDDLLQKN